MMLPAKRPNAPKKALLLSGGSIRGAFQVGAIRRLLEDGFQPDIVMGISAGALNSAFLANEAGKMNGHLDWPSIGKRLYDFWLEHVKKPEDLIRRVPILKQALRLLSKRFNGYFDYTPMINLIQNQLDYSQLEASPVELMVGAVDWADGHIEYASQSSQQIIDYVIASASIPVALPYWYINDRPYVDGGIRDIVPLKRLIDKGIEEIVVVLTHAHVSEKVSAREVGNLPLFVERVIDIMLNEILENDLRTLEKINQELESLQKDGIKPLNGLSSKRVIKSTIIRPDQAFDIELQSFNFQDVSRMIDEGYSVASTYRKSA